MNPTKESELASRRQFLKRSSVVVAGALSAGAFGGGQAHGANERLVVGLIGPGGMGTNLLRSFAAQPDVAISHVCDPDEGRRDKAAQLAAELTTRRPRAEKDLRRVLEDKSVDAVVIATPDHWHAPATILACEAGKHVYVEKPCSHNIREGRLMVEAARRYSRVVQVGTQNRSTAHVIRAMELLHNGAIGEVLAAKAWNSQRRQSIGRAQPTEPPANLDFDLWLGPAPKAPYRPNLLHGVWRWWEAFGTGDIGNDGVHDIDIARWGLGADKHPATVTALGGKYFFEDDQQFPDTQYVVFEYPDLRRRKRQLVFEQRLWSPYVQEGYENGDAFYGTDGMLLLGKSGGWQLFGPRNEPREKMTGAPDGPAHHRDFLDCVKTGHRPHADIEIGHWSATLAHLGNIATRVRRLLHFEPQAERIVGDEEANRLVGRTYREGHWAVPKGA
jgi:predicted dehydrogenase